MIKSTSLEALKAQIDIVDILENSLELKKAGANYKACCPFHGEKTASLVVSPSKQIWHCFGCGLGSDAIGFVQEYKKLSFIEAVEDIANDLNFSLEYEQNSNKKDYKTFMENINSYYLSNLDKDTKEYLLGRGLTKDSIKTFEIGFTKSSKEQISYINQQMFNISDATECGVVAIDDKSNTYARLSNRISFPIRNHTGKLIGFGGRITKGDGAKYINSPQTPLFDKSRNLYGYNIAKEYIYKKGTFVITEGYLDVIMFHQAGIKTAVATMGTALTELHCNTIKKAKAQVLLCFDGDKAGKSAALKASKLLCSHEVYGGVVIFPEGKDPADMVKDENTKELFDIMKKSTPLIKYVIETIASSFNLSIPQQKQEALRDIQEFLKTLAPLLQDEYKPFVAQTLSINQNHILVQQTQALHVEKHISTQTINVSEMNIIKSACEDDERLHVATQGLKVEMFDVHKEEFSMLINKDSKLQGLLLMDGLTIYTFKELQKEVKIMQIRHHTKELHEVIHSDGNYDKKSFEIKKLRGIIFELKKFIAKEIESES